MFGRRTAASHDVRVVDGWGQVTLPETPREAHQASLLRNFQDTRRTLDSARDLSTRSASALVEAEREHDEARKALRRVAEGTI